MNNVILTNADYNGVGAGISQGFKSCRHVAYNYVGESAIGIGLQLNSGVADVTIAGNLIEGGGARSVASGIAGSTTVQTAVSLGSAGTYDAALLVSDNWLRRVCPIADAVLRGIRVYGTRSGGHPLYRIVHNSLGMWCPELIGSGESPAPGVTVSARWGGSEVPGHLRSGFGFVEGRSLVRDGECPDGQAARALHQRNDGRRIDPARQKRADRDVGDEPQIHGRFERSLELLDGLLLGAVERAGQTAPGDVGGGPVHRARRRLEPRGG